MIRGALYSVALILGAYLLVALLEYFGRFNIAVRTFLFWSFIAGCGYVLVKYFIIPLGHMFRIGKIISHEQAAQIVGKHFPDVQDKLLNTLQLKEQAEKQGAGSLLEASINQKIAALRPVSFSSAIDLGQNRKYLRYALPPLGVILILLFAAPNILTKSTDRLLRHGQNIKEEAPFDITILNQSLQTPENENFTVNVEVNGEEIPDQVYVVVDGQQFLLQKDNNISFSYTFRNVQEDTEFSFLASGFYFDENVLKVIPTPRLVEFQVDLSYPSYTNHVNESIRNTGDLVVPEGTKINWKFLTRNTSKLNINFEDSTYVLNGEEEFRFSRIAENSNAYSLLTENEYMQSKDSIIYRLQVIPDLHPVINVMEERDSTSFKQLYFTGQVKDDYGFRRLTFNYQFIHAESGKADHDLKSVEIPINKANADDEFFHSWDLSEINIQPGDKISYYFEIWDNDGVNGSKSARTSLREYAAPTLDELEQEIDQQSEDIKDKLEDSLKDAKELQKDLEELKRDLLDKKEMNWQDKKKMEEMLKKQQQLQNQVQQIQQQNNQKNQQQSEIQQQEERILEKQQQLEQLMNEILSPEMQKMMEELQKLMEELNKEELQKELEDMKISNEDLEKQLDRALEEFKQMEFEEKMEQTIDKLEKLAEEQEKLSEESEKKESKSEDLKEKQDSLKSEFDELKEDIKELEKLNEELEDPNKMPETEPQEQQISEEQQKSSDELQKEKKSSASKSQKSAAQKMKEMANQMEMAMASNDAEKEEIDMEALRALLENIVTLSFDQEALMNEFKIVDQKDPKYNKLSQVQRKLKDDAKMVEDSLFALSKRVPQLSAAVNHEINLVNEYMSKALENIPDRKTPEVTTSQQYVMTSFNNLALMLDEALKQMQQKSSCNKPGTGNCEKPGGSGKPKPSASDMKKMQDALQKQLEECKKKGQNKGESKSGKEGMSKQLAEMAAKQAQIRKMMEEKAAELNEDGSGNGNELKEISKEMEELQKDIVNDNITEETLRRQQDIMIRLLKAEDAERIREQDNQRKSNEAQEIPVSNPEKYADYIRRREKETELLKTVPPELKPYYRGKVSEYFNRIGEK